MRWFSYLLCLCVLILGVGCASYPTGWKSKSGYDSDTYEYLEEEGVYAMTLDGDEHDACHRGSSWYNKKQRVEIQRAVVQGFNYQVEFEVKYSGNGGSSIFQLHPGRPASIPVDFNRECGNIDIRAGFNEIRLNIPGFAELRALSKGGYKDQWQKIRFDFRASNDRPFFRVYFNDQLKFDSSNFEPTYQGGICYYPGHNPHISLGLYRGHHQRYEHVEYRNVEFSRLGSDAF